MALIDRVRNQTALYWECTGNDGFGGVTVDDVVELRVYWMEKQEQFIDAGTGDAVLSKSVVYPGQDLVLMSYMKLGTLTNLDSDAMDNPLNAEDVFQIRGWNKIPDMSGQNFLRKAMLK